MDPKRVIRVSLSEGDFKDFEITKAASIDTDVTVLSIEKGKDGKFRLIYGKNYIEDFSKVTSIKMIREGIDLPKTKENLDYNNVIQHLNNQVLNQELDK